jgi:hypothetical protein
MALKTVRVPGPMEGPFVDAEQHVSRYFRDRKDDPEHGTIEIFGERYILVRAASLSVDFHALVERIYGEGRGREANEFAQSILFDLAHAVGRGEVRRQELPHQDGARRSHRQALGRAHSLRPRRLGVRRHLPGVEPRA